MKLDHTQPPASSFDAYLRLLRYIKPYWGYFALSIFGFLIFSATEPAQAKLLGMMIAAVQSKDSEARFYIPAMLIGLYVIRGVGTFLGAYFLSMVSTKIVHDLRTETFNHIMYLPTKFYDDNNSGHIMARIIFNTGQVTGAATDALKTIVREGLTVLALVSYVFYLNWQMSLVFFVVAPLIGLISKNVGKRLRKLSVKVQDSVAEVTQVCNEAVTGHRVVRNFGGEAYEMERFRSVSEYNLRKSLKMVRIAAMSTPLTQLVVIAAMGFVIFLILQPAFLNAMAADDYVAYLTSLAMLPKPLRQLSEVNGVVQRGIAAAESVFEILDLAPEPNSGTVVSPRLRGKIEIRHLTHRYADAKEVALADINLTIEPGQTVALVGRSGSGKSTLANLISRFYRHEQGQILVDDVDINDYDLYRLRQQFAVVTQTVTLFNDSVAGNIAYGTPREHIDMAQVEAAARKAFAYDFIQGLPEQFETMVGENGVKLSGGQKQRIAIARALMKDAPMLILDEATSALDNESERFIQAALEELMQTRTTLVIAHRLSTIVNADQILVLDAGRIVERGDHKTLIAAGGYYAKLYEHGFSE